MAERCPYCCQEIPNFPPIKIHPTGSVVIDGGRAVTLSGQSARLLIALAKAPGKMLHRDAVTVALWPNPKTTPMNLAVARHKSVRRLRRQLDNSRLLVEHTPCGTMLSLKFKCQPTNIEVISEALIAQEKMWWP